MRIDPEAFIVVAQQLASEPLLATIEGEWRSGGTTMGRSGLLCFSRAEMVFVEDQVMRPGRTHRIAMSAIRSWEDVDNYMGAELRLDTVDGPVIIGRIQQSAFPAFIVQLEIARGPAAAPPHPVDLRAPAAELTRTPVVPAPLPGAGDDPIQMTTETPALILTTAPEMAVVQVPGRDDAQRAALRIARSGLLGLLGRRPPPVELRLRSLPTAQVVPAGLPDELVPPPIRLPPLDLRETLTLPDHIAIQVMWKKSSFIETGRDFVDGIRAGRFGKGTRFKIDGTKGPGVHLGDTNLYSAHRPVGQVAREAVATERGGSKPPVGLVSFVICAVGFAIFGFVGVFFGVGVSMFVAKPIATAMRRNRGGPQ